MFRFTPSSSTRANKKYLTLFSICPQQRHYWIERNANASLRRPQGTTIRRRDQRDERILSRAATQISHQRRTPQFTHLHTYSTSSAPPQMQRIKIDTPVDPRFIRNIGVMAHIDAGKTTTTERMLFYAGYSNHLGDVDDGDTVTDYMPQEVDRGITITSAAITFPWNNGQNRINLIDTPGHIDFSLEVERSIRVLDGAVAIFDGAKGVEAQSHTVWKQATQHDVPKIIFINKMDKEGANLDFAMKTINVKLKAPTIAVQMPVGENRHFRAVVDLITMELIEFGDKDEGKSLTRTPVDQLDPDTYGQIQVSAITKREEMIDQITSYDEILADQYLNDEELTVQDIKAALRRITLSQKAHPVLCGSSLRNKGVQPLLDAIIDYLPSPLEKDAPTAKLVDSNETLPIPHDENGPFCALAFKVLHDRNRGPMVFFRVYSGKLSPRDKIYNATQNVMERVSKVVQMHANTPEEVSYVSAGNIGVAIGLKNTVTGDTLLSIKSQDRAYRLRGVKIPPPVFFQSIEVETNKQQAPLEEALRILKMEDPSVTTMVDEESAQLMLYGMGELHLDIIRDRLVNDFKVECYFGTIHISYREGITESTSHTHTIDQPSGTTRLLCTMILELSPLSDDEIARLPESANGNEVVFDLDEKLTKPSIDMITHHEETIKESVAYGLMRGPYLNYAMNGVRATVRGVRINSAIPAFANISAMQFCANKCVYEALKKLKEEKSVILKEPMMRVRITTDKAHLKNVLNDVSGKRGTISNVSHVLGDNVVEAVIPLKEMIGYSTHLRNITNGICSYEMEMASYEEMPETEKKKLFESFGYSAE